MSEITKFKTIIIDDDYWEIVEEYKYATSKGIIILPAGFRTDYASVLELHILLLEFLEIL